MKSFNLHRHSSLNRDVVFKISTNVANFNNIMPEYFKSLIVVKDNHTEKIVLEKISFLGQTINVKTKHVILPPNTHEVFILSGPLRGTSFIENYEISSNGTDIVISVNLEINGLLKFIPFLDKLLARKMSSVMSEFINSAENYSKKNFIVN